jgi:hypothetical protein
VYFVYVTEEAKFVWCLLSLRGVGSTTLAVRLHGKEAAAVGFVLIMWQFHTSCNSNQSAIGVFGMYGLQHTWQAVTATAL